MKTIVLIILQFVLIGLIILTGQIIPKQIPFLLIFLLGIIVAVLALVNSGSKKKKYKLAEIIGMIRYPFYSALLLITLSLILDLYTYERLILWIVLFVVLLMRLQEKEKPGKKKKGAKLKPSYRLIPFIY